MATATAMRVLGRTLAARPVPVHRISMAPRSLLRTSSLRKAVIIDTGEVVQRYPVGLAWFHWGIAGGTLACFGLVQAAMQTKGKLKGQLMFFHKSIGAALLIATAFRLGSRARAMMSKSIPPPLPNPAPLQWASHAAHAGLYFFMVALPVSGVAMGYFGGKGVPFFFTTIPGTDTPSKAIAGNAYKFHKQAGQIYEYLVPLHVGGSLVHALKGHKIFQRMSVFAKTT
eukprot:m.175137 g.175137  ORF g.175137 m.175137 type:complete len:227 (+) comp13941_c0_seq1:45-725(+)